MFKLLLRTVLLPAVLVYAIVGADPWGMFQGLLVCWNIILFFKFYATRCKSPRRLTGEPKNQLNILLVGDAFPPKVDGVSTFAVHTINLLHKKGHKLHILTSVTETPTLLGANVTRLPGIRMKYAPEHSISVPLPFKCLKLLWTLKPDVVHLFEYSFVTCFMAVYCWIAGVPCCWSHHTRIDLYIDLIKFPWYIPKIFQHLLYDVTDPACTYFAHGHLAVCKNLHDKYVHRFGYPNVRLWKTGVSDKFHPKNYCEDTRVMLSGGETDLPLVLHVGRISPDKQSEDLFPVLQALHKAMDGKVRIAVVGDGKPRPEIEALFKEAEIPAVFTGFLTGEPLQKSFASADVFFSPSMFEGFPIVYLEAMRSGLAVVAPADTGSSDTFHDDKHGLYYDNTGENRIQLAVDALIKTIERKDVYGKEATEYVQKFTWEAAVDELEDMLLFIADQHVAPSAVKNT